MDTLIEPEIIYNTTGQNTISSQLKETLEYFDDKKNNKPEIPNHQSIFLKEYEEN